jgi:alcohol dehydrogenase (cytochrome c)
MKTVSFLAALLGAALPIGALAQSADDLQNDQQTPADVLVYGMGYSGQRYSPMTRIDKSNVGQLVPKWAYSINDSPRRGGVPGRQGRRHLHDGP